MKKKTDYLELFLRAGALASFIGLIITVVLQVVTRFFFPSITLVWTEEGSRFLFMFSVAFGAPLAMKHEEYVNVDLILNIIPTKVRDIFEIIIYVASVGIFAILFKESLSFVRLGQRQMSPTLGIPMAVQHSVISIASFFIMLYGIVNIYKYFQRLKKRGEMQ